MKLVWSTKHEQRLLKHAEFIAGLRRGFDFAQIGELGEAFADRRTATSEEVKRTLRAVGRGSRSCGTSACAIGWLPCVFPRDICFEALACFTGLSGHSLHIAYRDEERQASLAGPDDFAVAADFFGFTFIRVYASSNVVSAATWLFDTQTYRHGRETTAKEVARRMRLLAKVLREHRNKEIGPLECDGSRLTANLLVPAGLNS